MVLHVCDHLGDFFDFWGLQVHQVVGLIIVLKVPEVDSEVVRRQEVLTIWANTQRVYIVVVAITKLHFLNTLVVVSLHLLLWKHNLITHHLALGELLAPCMLETPQLYNPIVC